jgi:predicted MPP superfamily phosphohydrolase
MARFLILSDIHACDEDPASSQAPSYVSSFNSAATARLDPLSDLKRVFVEDAFKPDYILCAGDITNRSSPTAFNYAWGRLHGLAADLGAQLIATVGNHDLDSRFQANKFDPRGYAMSLAPTLPVADRLSYLEYWAQNFTVLKFDDCNVAALNTAAYHGIGKDIENEIEHGRISEVTLEKLEHELSQLDPRPTNILLCHHHPIRGDHGDHDLIGLTRGGEKLVDILGRASSPWIIVHGHKHVPDLFYGHGGGSNAPVVLGSASFSAQVNRDAQNKNPNQVHLLITDPAGAAQEGLTYAGSVLSWTWQAGVGWSKAQGAQGLPHVTGFGYKASIDVLAQKLDDQLTADSRNHLSWNDAVGAVPSISRLVPTDFRSFREALRKLGLTILSDEDGAYAQIGRRA